MATQTILSKKYNLALWFNGFILLFWTYSMRPCLKICPPKFLRKKCKKSQS